MDSVLAFVYKNWQKKDVKELAALLSKEFDRSKGIDITDEVVVAVDNLLHRKILDIVDEKTLLYLRDKTWVGKDKKYLELLNKKLSIVSPEIILTEKRESLLKELESVENKLFNENESLLMTTR
jgi:predicted DNA-binding transcriptional regulator